VTNPSIFQTPSSPEVAIAFCEELLRLPNVVMLYSGAQHWEIFTALIRRVGARGNLIPDTYIAALALGHDCGVITNDRDFARFPGVRWRHPFDSR
jgi:toxin-antitoxin system PIN domain toxin